MSAFKSWSFSRYNAWVNCPRAAFLKFIKKAEGRPSDNKAMERGSAVDKAAELYILGTGPMIPELQDFQEVFDYYRQQPDLFVQEDWGFTREWEPCSSTDWNRCWLRVKVDVGYYDEPNRTVHIRDNKTGKLRDYKVQEYMLQLDLYAAAASVHYPDALYVDTRLNFTDQCVVYPEKVEERTCTIAEAQRKVGEWNERVAPMMQAQAFPPKPHRGCLYCPYSRTRECEY